MYGSNSLTLDNCDPIRGKQTDYTVTWKGRACLPTSLAVTACVVTASVCRPVGLGPCAQWSAAAGVPRAGRRHSLRLQHLRDGVVTSSPSCTYLRGPSGDGCELSCVSHVILIMLYNDGTVTNAKFEMDITT